MQISVVIPTCERKARLLSLLKNLDQFTHPVDEVIIVDSGNDKVLKEEYSVFTNLSITYVESERSVCIQRNTGIKMARSPWILLCDDDIELPNDYLQKLTDHISRHSEAGAVSGRWLEKDNGEWKATHPVQTARALLWKYFFQLGIWGEIECKGRNPIIRKIVKYYQRKANHISKAGWPVNTDFSGEYFVCPVYSLGACLVKKEWLLRSPFDEVLDSHGIGENYGVAVDIPGSIHVTNKAVVYHHLETTNRLKKTLQYYRRILALDYFVRTKRPKFGPKTKWLVWSLTGNLIQFIFSGNGAMALATLKAIAKIIFNKNPYQIAKTKNKKTIEPVLWKSRVTAGDG